MRITAAGFSFSLFALMGIASHPTAVADRTPASIGAQNQNPLWGTFESDTKAESAAEVLCLHFDKNKACPLTSLKENKIRTMIATVPDPDRTDLRLLFDRSLDSLLWAVADSGYSLESRWLPWSATPRESVALTLTPQPGPTTGGQQMLTLSRAKSDSRAKNWPGILLFRGDKWGDLMALFLVGETVTGGLDRPAFGKALEYIGQITNDPTQQHPLRDLWLVGPTFSGTFPSLKKAMQRQKWSFHIVSGTATDQDSQQNFLKKEFREYTVDFHATVENDAFAMHAFLHYLRHGWGNVGEIALLAEDQTAYGRVADELPDKESWEQWLVMRFPYGISRLRNSYEQENAAATLTNAEPQTPKGSTPQTLQFNLGSPDERDVVPAFSKVQSPISQEATLLSIASSLQREHVSYVGIMATDVLDAVFLTRFLRKTCPDARIFMLDSDLLFARAELNTALEGILNITTYPLFGRNQHWTGPERKGERPRRTAFANRYAEGEYNAARTQLREMDAITPEGKKGEILLDYRRPDTRPPDEGKPPLWLTVLGRDGYWPVALLDRVFRLEHETVVSSLAQAPHQEEVHPSEEMHPEPPSHAWSLILTLIVAIGVLHSFYIWFVYLYPNPPREISRKLNPVWRGVSAGLYRFFGAYPRATAESADPKKDPFAEESEARKCPRLLLVVTLVLACAQVVLAASGIPYVFSAGDKSFGDYLLFFVPLGSLALLLAAACSVSFCPGRNRAVGWVAWLGCLTFLGLWWWSLYGYHAEEQRVFFFAYRMSHPSNGVSPATPVLLLLGGLYAWGYMLLARRATVPPPSVPRLGNSIKLVEYLDDGLSKIAPWRSLIFALSVVVLWGFVFHGLDRMRSVEARSYDLLILLLLALNYGLLFAAWAQLLEAWKTFRRFLESLERHPMRKAFSRVPKELSTLPLFQREPQKVDLFTSARCSHTADALLGEIDPTVSALHIAARAAAIRYWMRCAEGQLANGLREQPDAYGQVSAVSHQLEQTVLMTANELVLWSQDEFWQCGDSDSLDPETGGDDLRRPIDSRVRERILTEEFIALRFVMYVRHVLRQMRSLLWFIVIDFVLTVLALSSYPFQSRRLIAVSCVGVLLILGAGFAVVFAQMDRDALLSRLSERKPHEIGASFYMRLASFGALPLLTVLATQFPSIGQFLSGWVQPALEALR
jgi:hypothetical protein